MINLTNYSNPLSLVNFCDKRLSKKQTKEVLKKYEPGCLAPGKAEVYKKLASVGDYIAVMGAIWKDSANRLAFLRELSGEFHGPLMFEHALAEFVASPTAETVNLVCLPMFKAAVFRVRQDAQCSSDPSVYYGDADQRLSIVYYRSLSRAVELRLERSMESIQTELVAERKESMGRRVTETALASKTTPLPSPAWVGQHGLSIHLDGRISMHPEESWKGRRDAYADKAIREVAELLPTH